MKISDHTFLCSICGREYKYHNHAVYVDPQSESLVMKCPVDGGVAFMVPPGPTIEEQIESLSEQVSELDERIEALREDSEVLEKGLEKFNEIEVDEKRISEINAMEEEEKTEDIQEELEGLKAGIKEKKDYINFMLGEYKPELKDALVASIETNKVTLKGYNDEKAILLEKIEELKEEKK